MGCSSPSPQPAVLKLSPQALLVSPCSHLSCSPAKLQLVPWDTHVHMRRNAALTPAGSAAHGLSFGWEITGKGQAGLLYHCSALLCAPGASGTCGWQHVCLPQRTAWHCALWFSSISSTAALLDKEPPVLVKTDQTQSLAES